MMNMKLCWHELHYLNKNFYETLKVLHTGEGEELVYGG